MKGKGATMNTYEVTWKRNNRWDVYPQEEPANVDRVQAIDDKHAVRLLVELPHVRVSPPIIVSVHQIHE
jgi:hypothetical protein